MANDKLEVPFANEGLSIISLQRANKLLRGLPWKCNDPLTRASLNFIHISHQIWSFSILSMWWCDILRLCHIIIKIFYKKMLLQQLNLNFKISKKNTEFFKMKVGKLTFLQTLAIGKFSMFYALSWSHFPFKRGQIWGGGREGLWPSSNRKIII